MRAREWMNVPTRRRAAGSWRCRATAFAGVAALLVSASRGAIASAEMTTERTAKWQAALQQYVQDPASHRHDVLRLGKQDADELPPMYRLALADAHMRSGHLRTAARMFGDIAAEEPGEPWQGFAAAGGGWASLMRGDRERARSFFEDASAAAGATGVLGDFMVGMLDARSGDTSSALDRFAKITDDPDASGDMRAAAAMGQGYASLWAGDDPGAEEAFARAATDDPSDRLGDDARYGDAFARWHHGDRDGAASALREILAIESPRPVEHDRGTLVDLSPQKLTRASARRYRRLPLRAPAEQVLNLLDRDARSAARVALRRIDAGEPAPRIATAAADGDAPSATAARDADRSGLRASAGPGTQPFASIARAARGDAARFPWLAALLLLVLLSLGARAVVRQLSGARS